MERLLHPGDWGFPHRSCKIARHTPVGQPLCQPPCTTKPLALSQGEGAVAKVKAGNSTMCQTSLRTLRAD
jgi:hypothetical protein